MDPSSKPWTALKPLEVAGILPPTARKWLREESAVVHGDSSVNQSRPEPVRDPYP